MSYMYNFRVLKSSRFVCVAVGQFISVDYSTSLLLSLTGTKALRWPADKHSRKHGQPHFLSTQTTKLHYYFYLILFCSIMVVAKASRASNFPEGIISSYYSSDC